MTTRKRALACALAFVMTTSFAAPISAQVVTPLGFDAASIGDVRLGVALATISELVDTPALLARPSSQSFVDDTFARIVASTNDAVVRARFGTYREDLRARDGAPFDRTRADGDLAAYTRDVLHALGSPRDRLCAVGLLAESIAYNARVLRSPSVDVDLRKALANAKIADTLFSGLSEQRAELAAMRPGRWVTIVEGARKIVTEIVGPDSAPPFPENGAVWVVLLRSGAVAGMSARRGTPHLWFDVVRFDDTHTTIGAYPRDADFAHDAHRLRCDVDREPDDASERALPIVPPPGTTSAQLADEFVARCTAQAKTSQPYRVRDASDARFIVDAMVAAGVDAAAIMRDATGRIK